MASARSSLFGDQREADMAGSLVDPGRSPARPRPPALDRRSLVDRDRRDPQVLGDEVVVGLGVGGGRVEELRDVTGGAARGEGEQRPRLCHRHPANLVGDQAQLARRDADVARLGAHRGRLWIGGHAYLSRPLEWPRKVRVGANSPSLWPTIDSETNTGTCLRPSWTAIVWPTISGKIV